MPCYKMHLMVKPVRIDKRKYVQGWCDWPEPSYKTRLRQQQDKLAKKEITKWLKG